MRRSTSAALLLLLLLVAACTAPDPAPGVDPDEPVTGTPDAPAPDRPDDPGAGVDTEQTRQEARGLLGMDEGALPADVRVARRGDEQFALTEDYVLGRRTVELEDVDGSGFRVVQVTVELSDGPETFTLELS